MTNVMEGIRILEVAEHTFVPAASGVLADWGAEVIKIEHVTRGDAARGLGSTGIAGFSGKVAVLMEHANRGKKSLGLDLTSDAGRDILYQLAAVSDVFLTNKMAGVRERLQIEVEQIRAHNPNIVYVRGTGYGNRGPDADAGGYDSLGFWARSGVAHSVTPSDLPQPVNQPGPAFGDSIGAMTIAGGISAALLHRERTGEATVVDISLLSTAMWAMGGTIAVSQDMGMAWQAPPAGQPAAPFNPLIGYFGTSDGRFIMFSMLQGFHYWPEVCERFDRMDLIGDPRFDTHEKLMENAAVGADDRSGARSRSTRSTRSSRSSPGCAASGRSCRTRWRSPTTRRWSPTATCPSSSTTATRTSWWRPRCSSTRNRRCPASHPTSTSTATRSSPSCSASTGTR